MLNAKSVLVTGCNRGIGLEFIKQILVLPVPPTHLFATCREPEKAEELKKLAEENPNLEVLELDILNPDQLERAAKRVEEVVGDKGLNLLINNAGIMKIEKSVADVTAECLADTFAINTIGPIMITKRFLPLLKMAAKLGGANSQNMNCSQAAILNNSSIQGCIGCLPQTLYGGNHAYRFSKGALNMFGMILSNELKEDGILVVSFNPGWVKTDLGGPDAWITTQESVSGLLSLLATRNQEHTGLLFDYDGKPLPW